MSSLNNPFRILLLTFMVAFLILSAMAVLYILNDRASSRHAPLLDASMEIKIELTTAHLWFEEIISGDSNELIKDVWKGFDEAEWYAEAILNGGENHHGKYLPAENEFITEIVTRFLAQLKSFREIAHERYKYHESSLSGSERDQKFDLVFEELIDSAEQIEMRLKLTIGDEIKQSKIITLSLMASIFIISILLGFYLFNRQKLTNRYQQELQEANKTLTLQANTDGLTNIFNRRYFDMFINKEWHRHHRYRHQISLLLIDVDYFKKYNDQYGHSKGDKCLIKVADVLSDVASRATDCVARYGGEEFVIVLPETNKDTAEYIAKKIIHQISAENIPHVSSEVSDKVTVSIGISTLIPQSPENPENIIKEADEALYAAKLNGRNRYIIAK